MDSTVEAQRTSSICNGCEPPKVQCNSSMNGQPKEHSDLSIPVRLPESPPKHFLNITRNLKTLSMRSSGWSPIQVGKLKSPSITHCVMEEGNSLHLVMCINPLPLP